MRISILAILFTISNLLMARTSDGQDLNKITVSIELKNASLKQAFRKIESLAKLAFTYKTDDVAGYGNISYQATNLPVARVLEELLQATDLRYEQVNSNIIIKKFNKNHTSSEFIPTAEELAFDGGIRGRVTNENGQPIANATILVIGADKGTAANSKGEFVIEGLKAGRHRLEISAVGYTTMVRDIVVKNNETADVSIAMSESNSKLEEVVVTALGINRKERSVGYATQQIKGENLTIAKEQNVVGSLAGKIAGVQVSGSSSASMGGTQRIQIRGVNMVTGEGDPLIVVDNTPISNTN
jgi:hypothetical protein